MAIYCNFDRREKIQTNQRMQTEVLRREEILSRCYITYAIIRRILNKLAPKGTPHPWLPMAIDANERHDSDLEWNHFSSGRRTNGHSRLQRKAKQDRRDGSRWRLYKTTCVARNIVRQNHEGSPHRDNDVKNEFRRR